MFILMYSEKSTMNWYATGATVEELQPDFDELKSRLSDEEIVVILPVAQMYQHTEANKL